MEKIKNMLHLNKDHDDGQTSHGSTHSSHAANSGTFNTTPSDVVPAAAAHSSHTSTSNTTHNPLSTGTNPVVGNKPSSTTGVYAGNQGLDHGRTTDSTAISGTGREGLGASSTAIPHRPAETGYQSGTTGTSGNTSTNYGTQGMPVTGQHTTYAANMLDPNQHSSGLTNERESALTHHKSGPDTATGGGAEAADGDHPGGIKGRTIDVAAREAGVGGPHSARTHLGEEGARTGVGSREQLADRGASYTGTHDVSGHGHSHDHTHSHTSGTAGVAGAGASLLAADQHRHDSSTLGSKIQPMGNTLHERNHYGNETSQSAILGSHPTHRETTHEHDAGALGSAPLHNSSALNAIDPRVDNQQHTNRGTGYSETSALGHDGGLGHSNTSTQHHGHSGSSSGIDMKTGRGISTTQDAALGAGNTSGIAGKPEATRSLAGHSEHHIGGHAPSSQDQRRAATLESSTHSHNPLTHSHGSSHNTSANVGDYSSGNTSTLGSSGLGHSSHHTSGNAGDYSSGNTSTLGSSGLGHSSHQTSGNTTTGTGGPYGAAGVGSALPQASNNPLNFAGNTDNYGSNSNTTRSTPVYDQMSSSTHNTTGHHTGGSESYSNLDPSVPRSGTTGLVGEGVNTRSEGIAGTTAGTGLGSHVGDASNIGNQQFGTITDHRR